MEWEQEESYENGEEFWVVGEKYYDKEFKDDVWSFLADVIIDKKKNLSKIEFDVFAFPRHIVEDSGWKTLSEAITALGEYLKEMEKINKIAKQMKLKIFSDEFIGFKTAFTIHSSNKKEIEKEIIRIKKTLNI